MRSIIVENGKIVAESQGTDTINEKNVFAGIIDTKNPIGRKRRTDGSFNNIPGGSFIFEPMENITIGEAISNKDSITSRKNEFISKLKEENEKEENEKEENIDIDTEKINNTIGSASINGELDYSRYGLEKVENDNNEDEEEEESLSEEYYGIKNEEETFEKIPKKKIRNDDPSNKY